jgi:hypothetical protein
VDEGDTLLVAFDRADRARDVAADGLPAGFEMVRRRSWSLLSIMAQGETWFLDDALTGSSRHCTSAACSRIPHG